MKRFAVVILAAGLMACGGSTPPAAETASPPAAPTPAEATAKPVTAGWTTTDSIQTPESVFYDSASGFIFTSQIDGAPDGHDACILEDVIEYELPFGAVGHVLGRPFVEWKLKRLFEFRHKVTRRALEPR